MAPGGHALDARSEGKMPLRRRAHLAVNAQGKAAIVRSRIVYTDVGSRRDIDAILFR